VTELHFKSALGIAQDIREKRISAVEALDHFLARMALHNPTLNAIIQTDLETARADAAAADAALAKGDIMGPLHGVPMTLKESYNIRGLPTTWGDPAYKNNIAGEDALAAQRLKAAGAVIFGKTNVPLMLADWQSFNKIYGTTNNPWDLTRTPGGSSGGAAAALASGMTGLEAGSDIGGSIRNPAHYCGVWGLKPSYGVLPPRGHSLPGAHAYADISVIGPLARSAADLEMAFGVMAGPEAAEAAAWRFEPPPPRVRSLKNLRVAVQTSTPVIETDAEYAERIHDVAEFLAKQGATVSDTALPDLDQVKAHQTYVTLLRATTSGRQPAELVEQNLKDIETLSPDDMSYYAMMARANVMRHRDWLPANNDRMRMRAVWAEFFRDWDVLLCPVGASAAFPQNETGTRWTRTLVVNGKEVLQNDQLFWSGWNGASGLPGVSAPIGLTRSGLPVGVQIIAPYLEDLTAIEVAKLLEQEYQAFEAPPGY
jgi:amidase